MKQFLIFSIFLCTLLSPIVFGQEAETASAWNRRSDLVLQAPPEKEPTAPPKIRKFKKQQEKTLAPISTKNLKEAPKRIQEVLKKTYKNDQEKLVSAVLYGDFSTGLIDSDSVAKILLVFKNRSLIPWKIYKEHYKQEKNPLLLFYQNLKRKFEEILGRKVFLVFTQVSKNSHEWDYDERHDFSEDIFPRLFEEHQLIGGQALLQDGFIRVSFAKKR